MLKYGDRYAVGTLVLIMNSEDHGTQLARIERESGIQVATAIGSSPQSFIRSFHARLLAEPSTDVRISQHCIRELETETDIDITIEFLRAQCLQSHKFPPVVAWQAFSTSLGGREDIRLHIGMPNEARTLRQYTVECRGQVLLEVELDSIFCISLKKLPSLLQNKIVANTSSERP